MRRCLRHGAVLLAVVMLTGGHWNVLQGVAWATMVLTRSWSGDVAQAVSTTFDGAHPCALCAVVDQAKAAEDDHGGDPADDLVKIAKTVKKDALPSGCMTIPGGIAEPGSWTRALAPGLEARRDAPPVPPPRAA
ncbi:MAG TPA: hypothetical protein VEL07_03970 [Planctomycetota bacterium]|nr:hypothetical protein [Planctomycetota bacterium]